MLFLTLAMNLGLLQQQPPVPSIFISGLVGSVFKMIVHMNF